MTEENSPQSEPQRVRYGTLPHQTMAIEYAVMMLSELFAGTPSKFGTLLSHAVISESPKAKK